MASLNSYTYRFELKNDDIIIERGDQRLRLKISEVLTYPLQLANLGFNTEEINKLTEEIKLHLLKNPLRKTVVFFTLKKEYICPEKPVILDEVIEFPKKWVLWKAFISNKHPPIFIIDRDGYLHPNKKEYALKQLEYEDLVNVLKLLPSSMLKKVLNIAELWSIKVEPKGRDEDDETYINRVAERIKELFYTPIPRLRDPIILKNIDWSEIIDQVIAFQTDEKDERLKIVHLATLLRGIRMDINPHSIQCTPGGTGKSTFYKMVGILFDKVSANTFLGFAKSPEEIYPGTIDGSELPILIDQIENQSAPQIMRFMFNVLEYGIGNVSTGAVSFSIQSRSIFNFAANPISEKSDPSKNFSLLITQLTHNPVMGRRFGIIVYGNDFRAIENRSLDYYEWHQKISLFRAVEEYAWREIQKILRNEKVWEWINTPIQDYANIIEGIVDNIDDDIVRTFLLEHARKAQHRVRGAALYCSIAKNLDKIALKQYSIDILLKHAEKYLNIIKEINIQSIKNIANEISEAKEIRVKAFFETAPEYLKEILSAVELYRRELAQKYEKIENVPQSEREILLKNLPYIPKKYPYFSKCVYKLLQRKNLPRKEFRDLYGFDIIYEDKELKIVLLDLERRDIEPLGSLSPFHQFHHFTNFEERDVVQKERKNEDNGSLRRRGNGENGETVKRENKTNKKVVSENVEKLRKLRNGEIIEWLNNALRDNPWMDLLSRKDVSQKAVKWGKRGNGEINRNKMESLPPTLSENSEKSEKLRLRDLDYSKFLELMEKNVIKYLEKIGRETIENLAYLLTYYKPWQLIGLSFNNIVEAEDFLKRLCNQNKIKIELGEDNKYWVSL